MLVKPIAAGADMQALAAQIHAIASMPSVRWAKEFGVEDVGYGIKELTVTAYLPESVTTDDVMDAVRGLKSPGGAHAGVKSVDLVAFQKA